MPRVLSTLTMFFVLILATSAAPADEKPMSPAEVGKKIITVAPPNKLVLRLDGEIAKLLELNKMEVVQVLISLKNSNAMDVAPEVQKLLTSCGLVTAIEKTNTLVVTDIASNIRRIYQILQVVDVKQWGIFAGYSCRWTKAQDVADKLKIRLADTKNDGGCDSQPANKDSDRRNSDGRAHREWDVSISVDAKSNKLFIVAPPDKMELAMTFVEEMDKPQPPKADPILRKYSVPAGTTDMVVKTLQQNEPGLKVIALQMTSEIMVLATEEEHAAIRAKLKAKEDKEKESPSVVIKFGPLSAQSACYRLKRDGSFADVFGRVKADEQLKGIIESETTSGNAMIYVAIDSNVELSVVRDFAKRVSACKPPTVRVIISIDVLDK